MNGKSNKPHGFTLEDIVKAFDGQFSVKDVSGKLGISPQAVYYHLGRNNIKISDVTVASNSKCPNAATIIKLMEEDGLTAVDIAKTHNVTSTRVYQVLRSKKIDVRSIKHHKNNSLKKLPDNLHSAQKPTDGSHNLRAVPPRCCYTCQFFDKSSVSCSRHGYKWDNPIDLFYFICNTYIVVHETNPRYKGVIQCAQSS